jgi:hypothetical protein
MTDMPHSSDAAMQRDHRRWWVWACWRTGGPNPVILYGCAAQIQSEPNAVTTVQLPLPDGGSLVIHHQVFSGTAFATFRAALVGGDIKLEILFGPGSPAAPVRAERRIIHAVFGHSAARVHAYCSMPDGADAFGAHGGAAAEILAHLQREVGLPFADDYLPHIGNFEILALADWGERLPPFLIETVAPPAPAQPPRSPRAMVVARTPVFAAVRHFAHIVIRETGEILEERLIELPPGLCRSDPIAVDDVIDSFEFYLFAENGTLIHRETGHFIREVAVNMAVAGPTIVTQDGLVTATIDEPRGGKANQVSCSDGILPLRRRFGSEGPQR